MTNGNTFRDGGSKIKVVHLKVSRAPKGTSNTQYNYTWYMILLSVVDRGCDCNYDLSHGV